MKHLFLLALLATSNAHAVLLTTSANGAFEVTRVTSFQLGGVASFSDNAAELMATPWWNDDTLSDELALLWFNDQGYNPSNFGGSIESLWFASSNSTNGTVRASFVDFFGNPLQVPNNIGDRGFYATGYRVVSPVPVPAAAWLFMSGLLGLVYKGRKAGQAAA